MEETSEELPNFSIGIDLLGPDPTSNKNKAEKNSQVARFANLSEDQLQQILAKRHSLGTKKGDQLVINNFRGKISAFIVVSLGIYQNQKNHNYTLITIRGFFAQILVVALFVIKEYTYAFSCAYIELWMHLR